MNLTTFKALVLREYWENKSFIRVPVILAAVILFSLLVGMITTQSMVFDMGGNEFVIEEGLSQLSSAEVDELSMGVQLFQYGSFLAPLSTGMLFVIFFYVLGSLYNERKDKSILFWKSMPVSDLQTVMSKVFAALVVVPVITAGVTIVAQVIGLILATLMVWFNGGSAWDLIWSNSAFFKVAFNNLFVLMVLALWMVPVLGWLWLVSAYSKRAPFLIAVFVPLGIMLVEGLILRSAEFATLIGHYFWQLKEIVQIMGDRGHPFGVVTAIEFWGGLVIGAAFISGAVYIRRFRDDSY